VLAVTVLTKVSALVIAGGAPLAALALRPGGRTPWGRLLGAYAIAAAVFGALLLHPQATMLYGGTTDRYAFSPTDLLTVPWRAWGSNFRHLAEALAGYLPAPLWILYAAGLALPFVTRDRRDAVLAAWCVLLLGSTLLLDKVFYFRYYVPGAVAGLLPAARALTLAAAVLGRAVAALSRAAGRRGRGPVLAGRLAGALFLAAAAVPGLALQWQLGHDPYDAALPGDRIGDREQYVLSRNAGWETDRLVDLLSDAAAREPIVVVVSPLTGHMRAWVEARLLYVPGVHILLRDPRQTPATQVLGLNRDDEIRRLAVGGGAVYFATSEWAGAANEQPYLENDGDAAELIADFPRHDLPWRHRVYRLHFPHELDRVRLTRPAVFGAGGELALLGYDLQPPAADGGATQELTLYWEARRPPGDSYTVFVHAVAPGPDAPIVAQHDGLPGDGARPTDRWRPGEIVPDRHPLVLPAPPACGPYRLFVGWYDRETLRRLPVVQGAADAAAPGGTPSPEADAVELRPLGGAACGP
jgi:hypothetical protein